ncbi:HlyD family efflux transporter periplasmic adaptor subunit [Guyparkeria halophila]|uniref:HlyD family efflux transporter periplasmic adaptor subunit n=1 Tax=Guyparkeria halophila TaxID=47960 RepID=A0ABZ0Z0G5_9GAMM|nr:HlyD family efflux transporter periplasmic adaptor subunit [Guyparkeria halophila]WQH16927.1 HlyD family efflux transporter periplasmic adaptor subunit [Guyparkeria halophila]
MKRIQSSWARRLIGPVALLGAGLAAPAWAVEIEGQLGFADRVALSTPVAGVVESVPVRAGERVEAGALLLALDSTPFDQRHRMAAAQIEGLSLAADEAALDAERVQALYDRTVGSDSERALAVIAREQAQGERDRVRAQAALRAWERDQARLEAPFAARILSVDAAVGEVVSPQLTPPTLIEIARADQLLATSRISADQLGSLALGDEVTVARGDDRRTGMVDAIRAFSDGNGPVQYELAVRVERGDGWRAGQSVVLELPDD